MELAVNLLCDASKTASFGSGVDAWVTTGEKKLDVPLI